MHITTPEFLALSSAQKLLNSIDPVFMEKETGEQYTLRKDRGGAAKPVFMISDSLSLSLYSQHSTGILDEMFHKYSLYI
jgi:hypothetical protein